MYWMKLVNMCHGSKCMSELIKYRPYVAISEMTMSRKVLFVSRSVPMCFHSSSVTAATERYTVKPAHHSVMALHRPKRMIAAMYVNLEPCGRLPSEQTVTTKRSAMYSLRKISNTCLPAPALRKLKASFWPEVVAEPTRKKKAR
jgi:hypothetical protein